MLKVGFFMQIKLVETIALSEQGQFDDFFRVAYKVES